jgi:hypothetical protein
MFKKSSFNYIVGALFILILGASCTNPALTEVDRRLTYTVRIFPEPEHGNIRLSDERVSAGTWISIYANPDPGYVLQTIILQASEGNPSSVNISNSKYSTSINSHNDITAVFAPKLSGTYTISVDAGISNGLIYASTLNSETGTQVRINVLPEDGYDLADGSLKVNGGAVSISAGLPYMFTMPSDDVKIEAQFEKLGTEALAASARKYLSAGQYDIAVSLYEAAYQNNQSEPEFILYSALGKLGNILIDPDVRSLLGFGSLYMSVVPGSLDDWICDDVYWTGTDQERWYTTYAATIYTPDDATRPKINGRISNFSTPFGDFPLNQEPGRDWLNPNERLDPSDSSSPVRNTVPTREKFLNYMFYALNASYRSGFNPFIEKVERYVFGAKFEEAAARAASLPDNARVLLNPRLKAQFNLEDLYGTGDTYIGKPELDYIFGAVRALKAAFEYLSVYDWSTDLRPWKLGQLNWEDGPDSILDKMFALQESVEEHKNFWRDLSVVAQILPLKNNFLTVHNTRAMDKAKTDFTSALAMTNASMNYWFNASPGNTSQFIADARTKRQWARDGLAAARSALSTGGNFYFPKKLPKSEVGASWPVEAGADYGINMGKFFTPGVFTLTNLLTTEWGGRAPSLFKVEWYEDYRNDYTFVFTGNYSPVTELITGSGDEENVAGTDNSAPYGIYSFEVNTKNLKEIFPKGFEEFGDKALLYKVFPSIPIWPWEVTYFKGVNRPARKLYEFYHKTTIDK